MAHELSFHEGKAEMCYAGAKPWHGLGTQVPGLMSTDEALTAAHLTWGLKKEKVYRINADGFKEVPDAFVIARDDNDAELGIVGNKYEPICNKEAFSFFDRVLGNSSAQIETAGALGKGERVFMLAKMPEIQQILPGDIMEQYLLVSTSHDGTGATEVLFTNIRVVCVNTLTAALRGCKNRTRIIHTANFKERMAQAEKTLMESRSYWGKVQEMAKHLASTSVSRVEVGMFMDHMFPIKNEEAKNTRLLGTRNKFEQLVESGMGTEIPGVRGTAWGLYNAYSEWLQYSKTVHGDEATKTAKRWENIVFGTAANDLQKALDQCLAIAS